jgi:hypothetical protein
VTLPATHINDEPTQFEDASNRGHTVKLHPAASNKNKIKNRQNAERIRCQQATNQEHRKHSLKQYIVQIPAVESTHNATST